MRILWFTWKDSEHPQAGGAEVVAHEVAKRLVAEGHEVVLLTSSFAGCKREADIDGYRVIRGGNRYTVYFFASHYYRMQLKGWADVVIEEINTIPFFTQFYVHEPRVLFFHQLCREIWWYQMVFPMSLIGYLIEPLYLRLLNKNPTMTVSQSTKDDLVRYGFKPERIHIISEGLQITPLAELPPKKPVPARAVWLSLSALRPMKRTLEIVKAFELFVGTHPRAKLAIVGDTSGAYAKKVRAYIAQSPARGQIEIIGRVSVKEKIAWYQKADLIVVASVKEGWGLIVTEANCQGTPAVVYNIDGLRDSVRHGETGLVAQENSPAGLAHAASQLIDDENSYQALRQEAWQWSKTITFGQSAEDVLSLIKTYAK